MNKPMYQIITEPVNLTYTSHKNPSSLEITILMLSYRILQENFLWEPCRRIGFKVKTFPEELHSKKKFHGVLKLYKESKNFEGEALVFECNAGILFKDPVTQEMLGRETETLCKHMLKFALTVGKKA